MTFLYIQNYKNTKINLKIEIINKNTIQTKEQHSCTIKSRHRI